MRDTHAHTHTHTHTCMQCSVLFLMLFQRETRYLPRINTCIVGGGKESIKIFIKFLFFILRWLLLFLICPPFQLGSPFWMRHHHLLFLQYGGSTSALVVAHPRITFDLVSISHLFLLLCWNTRCVATRLSERAFNCISHAKTNEMNYVSLVISLHSHLLPTICFFFLPQRWRHLSASSTSGGLMYWLNWLARLAWPMKITIDGWISSWFRKKRCLLNYSVDSLTSNERIGVRAVWFCTANCVIVLCQCWMTDV